MVVDKDPDRLEGTFSIELNSRIYTLRARTDADAQIWVDSLLKIREKGKNYMFPFFKNFN